MTIFQQLCLLMLSNDKEEEAPVLLHPDDSKCLVCVWK